VLVSVNAPARAIVLLCGKENIMIFGLGLEKAGRNPDTMRRALELGVKFYDMAPTYNFGLCEKDFGDEVKGSGVARDSLIISTKTHERRPQQALMLLENSLRALQTDYVDIWSLHDLSTPFDLKVTSALDQAKASGKAKYVGITCNRDPMLLKQALQEYPFDYAMMTVNIADKHFASFIDNVLPYVGNTKVIAMQVFMRGKSRYPIHGFINDQLEANKHLCPNDQSKMYMHRTKTTLISGKWICPKCGFAGEEDPVGLQLLQDCINYTASFPIEVMLIGCNGVAQLEYDLELFNARQAMTNEQKATIESATAPYGDMLNFFKSLYNPEAGVKRIQADTIKVTK